MHYIFANRWTQNMELVVFSTWLILNGPHKIQERGTLDPINAIHYLLRYIVWTNILSQFAEQICLWDSFDLNEQLFNILPSLTQLILDFLIISIILISKMTFKLYISATVYRTLSYRLFCSTFISSKGMCISVLWIRILALQRG